MFVSIELTLLLLAVYIITYFLNKQLPMRFLGLANHWIRWISFACVFSLILTFFEWSSRPEWVHFVSGLALWFILETLFYKISIHMLNISEMELFPKYKNDTDENLWPLNKEVLKVKELLSKEGFKFEETLKAQIVSHITIRQAIFLDETQKIRLNILFIPNAHNQIKLFYSLLSTKVSGENLIMDNQNMPFGGFYPKHWSVNRFPLCHSLKQLLKKHRKAIEKTADKWALLDEDILTKTNKLQRELERENQDMGFLNMPNNEEKGQISPEGCFRIWTEMWLLAYFGKTLS
ncbi:MAG: hypothetical protein P8I61_05055 [Opitutae bacterium]|jgi:hypothetical protein|nr:hypothetical protein [Opitutae bacterium]